MLLSRFTLTFPKSVLVCCTSGTGSFFIFWGAGEDYDRILYNTSEFNGTKKADLFFAGDQHLIPFDGTPTRAPSRSLSPSSGPSVSPAPSSFGVASLTVVIEPGTFPEVRETVPSLLFEVASNKEWFSRCSDWLGLSFRMIFLF